MADKKSSGDGSARTRGSGGKKGQLNIPYGSVVSPQPGNTQPTASDSVGQQGGSGGGSSDANAGGQSGGTGSQGSGVDS